MKLTKKVSSKKNLLISIFLILTGTMLTFQPPIDPDFGWHYKYGEYAVENRSLLKNNIYSYVTEGNEWTSFYWASEVIYYTLHSQLPPILPGLILSLIFSCALITTLSKYGVNNVGKLIAVVTISLYMGSYVIVARPMFFSSLFFLLLMYILTKRVKYIYYLPILFAVWTNLHADCLFGLMILGIYLLFDLLEKNKQNLLTPKYFAKTSLFMLVCVSVTLINPYGVELWKTLASEALMANKGVVAEWRALSFGEDWSAHLSYIVVMSITGFILAATYLDAKKWKPWYVVVIGIFFIIASKSVYFFRILILISAGSAAIFWGDFISKLYNSILKVDVRKALKRISTITLIMIFLVSLSYFLEKIILASDISLWAAERKYPYAAIETIRITPKLEGHLLNSYGWGGFLIWQLPEHKTFIDGRLASWGVDREPSLIIEYIGAGESIENLEDLITKYKITWMLIKPDSKHGEVILEHRERFNIIENTDVYILASVK